MNENNVGEFFQVLQMIRQNRFQHIYVQVLIFMDGDIAKADHAFHFGSQ